MDNGNEIRDFLVTRRARITPEQAGLPAYGGNRRVAGLRREEVAMLAGVSIDYYVRMERGSLAGASDAVLEGMARALQLDDAERGHLFDLARGSEPQPARLRRGRDPGIPGGGQQAPAATACSPPTASPAPCTRRCSPARAARRTTPASSTWTPPPATSSPTGTA